MGRGAALLAILFAAGPAAAQVTVNPGALELLPAPKAAPARPARPPARAPTPPAGRPAPRTATPAPAAPAPQAAAPAPAAPAVPPPEARPAMPVVPPAVAALPPPPPLPPTRPMPPPTVPLAADAPGSAAPLPNGVRVTFGPDRQDLNPVTEDALRALARRLQADDKATINVYAYAAGSPEDPSTARRLSLARALAARAVLINAGIASTRIYPRALGPSGGETDRDRVDVVAGPPGPPPSGAAVGAAVGAPVGAVPK